MPRLRLKRKTFSLFLDLVLVVSVLGFSNTKMADHMNMIKKKKVMTFSSDTEKASYKIQYPFMITKLG